MRHSSPKSGIGLQTNLKAPILLAQTFARQFPDGQQGNIVSLIDQRVWRPTPEYLSYSISKAGLSAARACSRRLSHLEML